MKDWFHSLCIKDSGVLYEDPYIQVNFFCDYCAQIHFILLRLFKDWPGWIGVLFV